MRITLQENRDFTPTALVAYLNKKYTLKKSGTKFNIRDIHQYSLRGRLPDTYGGNSITIISNDTIGIKILRLHK